MKASDDAWLAAVRLPDPDASGNIVAKHHVLFATFKDDDAAVKGSLFN